MQLSFELTQQDFFQALRLHFQRSLTTRFAQVFAPLIVLGYLFARFTQGSSPLVQNFQPLAILAALWIPLSFLVPWTSARTQFKNQPGAHGLKQLSIDELGLHWIWSGGSADINWTNFTKFREGKNLFLVYSSKVMFNIVPKRAFTADEMGEFRSLLKQHLKAY